MHATPPPAPPAAASNAIADAMRIVAWEVGPATCDGAPAPVIRLERPRPVPIDIATAATQGPLTFTFTFRLTAAGRSHAIAPVDAPPPSDSAGDTTPPDIDLQPALAASTFAPGHEGARCSITYTPHAYALADAAPEDLARLYVMDDDARNFDPLRARFATAATDCFGSLHPLDLHYPDIARTPGHAAPVLLRFDTDANGNPVHIETMLNDGDAALVAQVAASLAQSRFQDRNRHGCLWPGGTPAGDLPVPVPRGPLEGFLPPGSTCPVHIAHSLNLAEVPFPPAFRFHGVNGSVVVRFDLLADGTVVGATALLAEPAAAFGEAAVTVISSATGQPAAGTQSGCVARISFELRDDMRETTFVRP